MDLAATPLNEILAEFESHWIGREVEGDEYLPAEAAFFRDIVDGVVADQRRLDPMIDQALAEGLAAQADRDRAARDPARRRLRARPASPTFRRASSSRNMSTSPTPSSSATRPAWSTPCSTSSRGNCAPASSSARRGDAVAQARDSQEPSGEDRLIARYFKPIARHPGALGLIDDAAMLTPPPGPRAGAHRRRHRRRRAFLPRRSAGRGRAQGAAGQPVRSRRQGRQARGLPADAGAAEGHRRRLAQGVRARARRRRRSDTDVRCSAATP